MKFRAFIIVAISLLLLSCGKDAVVDAKMEEIAGEYILTEYLVKTSNEKGAYVQALPDGLSYADMKAEVIKDSGVWYFAFTMPVKWKDGTFSFIEVEQPMTWSPSLGMYCFIGEQYAFKDKTGYDVYSTRLFYDEEKHKMVLHHYSESLGLQRSYNWIKQ